MKKAYLFLVAMLTVAVVLAGCSGGEKEEKETDKKQEKETEEVANETEEEPEEEPEEEEPKEEKASEGDVNFDGMIKEMEEITQGETELIFENNEAMTEEMDGVKITMDGYVLTELNDFHTDFEIPFDDNTDGGVMLAHYTIENGQGEDVYYTPQFDISYTGYTRTRSNQKQLLPEEEQLNTLLGPSNDYELPKGETVSGYVAYAFSPDELEEILELGEIEISVRAAAENYDPETYDYKPLIGEDSKFKVAMSDEGEEKVADSGQFYEDDVTYDNMGEKTMMKEKSDLDESVSLRDSKVTLNGYQFTEFEPNEVEAPRFENFDEGVVLLTVDMEIENNESDDVGLSSLSSKLEVNDGKQYLLSEGMLMNYRNDDIIEAGKSGEWLQVFIMDKEQYEKIWKDKKFELEVGPLKSPDVKDLSKGQKETIVLPN